MAASAVGCGNFSSSPSTRKGWLQIFRSSMLIVGSFTASFCTVKCAPKNSTDGLKMAALWLAINWALDLAVLVPLMVSGEKQTLNLDSWAAMVPTWFTRIGAAYVGFVSMCVVGGACAERGAGKGAGVAAGSSKKRA